jgi:hypothetical protein
MSAAKYKSAFPRVVKSRYTNRKYRISPRRSFEVVQVRSSASPEQMSGSTCIAIIERDGEKRITPYGRISAIEALTKVCKNEGRLADFNNVTWDLAQPLTTTQPMSHGIHHEHVMGGKKPKRSKSKKLALIPRDPASVPVVTPTRPNDLDIVLRMCDELNESPTLRTVWNKLAPRLLTAT